MVKFFLILDKRKIRKTSISQESSPKKSLEEKWVNKKIEVKEK